MKTSLFSQSLLFASFWMNYSFAKTATSHPLGRPLSVRRKRSHSPTFTNQDKEHKRELASRSEVGTIFFLKENESGFHRQLSYSFIDDVSEEFQWGLNDLSMSVNNSPLMFDGDDFFQSFSYNSVSPSSINHQNIDSESFPSQSPSIYPLLSNDDDNNNDDDTAIKLSCLDEWKIPIESATFEVEFTIQLKAMQTILFSFTKIMNFASSVISNVGALILNCKDENIKEDLNDLMGEIVAINMTAPKVVELACSSESNAVKNTCTAISSTFVLTAIGNVTLEFKEDIASVMGDLFQNILANRGVPVSGIEVDVHPIEEDIHYNLDVEPTDQPLLTDANDSKDDDVEMQKEEETKDPFMDTKTKDVGSSSSSHLGQDIVSSMKTKRPPSSFFVLFTFVGGAIVIIMLVVIILWRNRKASSSSRSLSTADNDGDENLGYGFVAPSHTA